jgi:hypothetical protein
MVRGQLAGHRDDEFHGAKRFPRSEHLKMTERFTPVSPGIVEWRVTFDDPHTWTRPWTFTWTFTMMLKQKDTERAGVRIRVARSQIWPEEHPHWRARKR